MPETSKTSSARSAGSVGISVTRFIDLEEPLQLESGRTFGPVRIAYETYGSLSPARDNVILVCHALSGDAHAAGWSADAEAPTAVDGIGAEERGIRSRSGLGWWDNLIGPGKAFDTDRYHVICMNLLGSCRGSTGPSSIDPRIGRPYGLSFPTITVADMVLVQRNALRALGINSLLAIAGGSLGGMQALEWSVTFPNTVRGCILTASTARLSSQGVGWNAVARNAIMADPDWQNGNYYGSGREPRAGIGIARMIGHITYLSRESMNEKFGRKLQKGDRYSYDVTGADFAVESYLRHQAETFADRFDANSYLYISRALTYFDLARSHGDGSLVRALAPACARFLLASFSSDWLYPPADSMDLLEALLAAGKQAEHHCIQTSYGHDSFLLEDELQAEFISRFLRTIAGAETTGTEKHS